MDAVRRLATLSAVALLSGLLVAPAAPAAAAEPTTESSAATFTLFT